MKYMYSSVLSTYLFDENFSIVKEKRIQNPIELDKGLWTQEEKALIAANKNEKIIFVGQKKEKIQGVEFTNDENVINKVLKASKNNFDEHFSITIKITKKKISESFSKEFFIVQTINAITELEKSINLLSKRVREMYSVYAPEVEKKLSDNDSFVRMIITKDKSELFKELNISESMGASVPKEDIDSVLELANCIYKLIQEKIKKEQYLEQIVLIVAPNLTAICDAKIASKLIAIAGSLRKLAFFPAGTIQTLGAEKALFEHLKNKANPPKYGVIMGHPLVMNAPIKEKGKMARRLANKILIAVKVDYFNHDNNTIGYELKEKLEKSN